MARSSLVALGIVEALFPARLTDWFENTAYENPDDVVRKEWLLSVVRAEGVVLALVSLLGGRGYAWLLNTMGFVGQSRPVSLDSTWVSQRNWPTRIRRKSSRPTGFSVLSAGLAFSTS